MKSVEAKKQEARNKKTLHRMPMGKPQGVPAI